MTTLILDRIGTVVPEHENLSDLKHLDVWLARFLINEVPEISIKHLMDDVWEDEPSELSQALQRSLDHNNDDTSVPALLARIQAKAVRNQSDE